MVASDQLLGRAVSGDEAALQILLLDYHDVLSAHISKRLPNDLQRSISAEDVVQEVYMTVFRKIRDFEPREKGGFYTWLIRIADRRLSDFIAHERCAKRGGARVPIEAAAPQDHGDLIELLEYAAAHSHTPSRSATEHEAVEAVHRGLAQLKEEQREALQFRFLEGLSVAEAAARMERSEGAVRMLCNRGLASLRRFLGDLSHFLTRLP